MERKNREEANGRRKGGYCARLKWTQVFLLAIMAGPAVLPVLVSFVDFAASYAAGDAPFVDVVPDWLGGKRRKAYGSGGAPPNSSEQGAKKSFEPRNSPYRDRLRVFYEKHNPEKAGAKNLDRVLEKYWGREKELFRSLDSKYGLKSKKKKKKNGKRRKNQKEKEEGKGEGGVG